MARNRSHTGPRAFGAGSSHEHGFRPFYDGLTHLFVTPEDLLPVIALALLAGLRGPCFGRSVLFVLPVAWLVGSTVGVWIAPQLTLPGLEIILTIGLVESVIKDHDGSEKDREEHKKCKI